jgi:membrane protease subunit (stomatin/prohibitin family)
MNITEIIKYEGPNNVLVWKHPAEDFNTTSQLIVAQTQKAALFYNGQICDIFEAGRHELKTGNIPLLNRLVNLPTDGVSPFHCVVYYINLVDSMDILWGTPSPIDIKEPEFNVIIPVGANGQFAVRVIDEKKLLIKLVGTMAEFDQEMLSKYFKGLLLQHVNQELSKALISKKISFLEINSHLSEIAAEMQKNISDGLENYGIGLVSFYIKNIAVPEDNPSFVKLKDALAKKTEFDVLGTSYQQARTFDVLETAAGNEGGGGSDVMGAGIGLGMGVNMGSQFGGAMAGAMQNAGSVGMAPVGGENAQAPESGAAKKFCPNCGTKLGGKE